MKLITGFSFRAITYLKSLTLFLDRMVSNFLMSLGFCNLIASYIYKGSTIKFLGTSITPKNLPSRETLILIFYCAAFNNSVMSSHF